jgi:hypothetical protein
VASSQKKTNKWLLVPLIRKKIKNKKLLLSLFQTLNKKKKKKKQLTD